MSLKQLDIYNVRNIHKQSITPSSQFNFIYGKNASGKSAIIEAIFLLGRAKSFRTPSIKSVVTFNKQYLTVSGEVADENIHSIHMGIQMDGKITEMRINHQPNNNRAKLAFNLPLQIIHPKSFELLDAGSQVRREFVDWGVFNQDENFLAIWRKYKRALMQRNTLLKLKEIDQITSWNHELASYGTQVNELRFNYLNKLKPFLISIIKKFLKYDSVDFNLLSGWKMEDSLLQNLNDDLDKDLRYGYTHSGPHRGDFQILIDKILAKDLLSRGQLKLLVICLKLAQVELILNERDAFGSILIDDFAAELDKDNRAMILRYLNGIKCQVFLTTTEMDDFGDLEYLENYKLFHVEHGKLRWVNVPHGTAVMT